MRSAPASRRNSPPPRFSDDPFSLFTTPPADETPEAKKNRERAESIARRISEQIDESLNQEREALKKRKSVKVLLLGQSESGKSTTLKNFQLKFSPKSWKQERLVWTSVIQLNLIRNATTILDMMKHEMAHAKSAKEVTEEPIHFTEQHHLLNRKLGPLRGAQKDLERKLGASAFEEDHEGASDLEEESMTLDGESGFHGSRRDPREFYVQCNNTWKDRFKMQPSSSKSHAGDVDNIASLLEICKDDMVALWQDPIIQTMLNQMKYRPEDSPGFFLEDVDRIGRRDYEPSDDDIIRARIRTLGVQEYRYTLDEVGSEWRIFDVGGSRSSRSAWAPFFDDADAIIFLAPLNCFDQKLVEDPRVNRLQDSYQLWKSVVSNKLLAKTQIILFLNKYDLLERKLERGVMVKSYVPSYGARENTPESAVKYFEQHFRDVHKKYSAGAQRSFYLHVTSVVDTKATHTTLALVEDNILRNYLERSALV